MGLITALAGLHPDGTVLHRLRRASRAVSWAQLAGRLRQLDHHRHHRELCGHRLPSGRLLHQIIAGAASLPSSREARGLNITIVPARSLACRRPRLSEDAAWRLRCVSSEAHGLAAIPSGVPADRMRSDPDASASSCACSALSLHRSPCIVTAPLPRPAALCSTASRASPVRARASLGLVSVRLPWAPAAPVRSLAWPPRGSAPAARALSSARLCVVPATTALPAVLLLRCPTVAPPRPALLPPESCGPVRCLLRSLRLSRGRPRRRAPSSLWLPVCFHSSTRFHCCGAKVKAGRGGGGPGGSGKRKERARKRKV
jgi:hypothetical protein